MKFFFGFLIQTLTKPFTDELSFQPKTHPKEEEYQSSCLCTELRLLPFGSKLLMFFDIISRLEAFPTPFGHQKFHTKLFFPKVVTKTHHVLLFKVPFAWIFQDLSRCLFSRTRSFFEEEHRDGIPKCDRLSGKMRSFKRNGSKAKRDTFTVVSTIVFF